MIRSCLIAGWILFGGAAYCQQVVLEPGDELSVDIIRSQELGRTVIIGAEGEIRLPYVGEIVVQGLSVEAAREKVARALAQRIDIDPESVLIDIVSRTPVFVMTEGIGSGPIPYRPGMTALMAAASVMPQGRQGSDLSLIEELEMARKPFELDQTRERLAVAAIKIARLRSEAEEGEFEPPTAEDLGLSPEQRDRLVVREEAALEARRTLDANQDKLLAAQEASQRALIDRLEEQAKVLEERKALLQSEETRIEDLSSQGLAAQSRLEAIRGTVLEVEFARIEVLAELGEAQSAAAAIQQLRGSQRDNRRVAVTESIRDLSSDVAQLQKQISSFEKQISLGRVTALELGSDGTQVHRKAAIAIFRDGVLVDARPEDILHPGDVVIVQSRSP